MEANKTSKPNLGLYKAPQKGISLGYTLLKLQLWKGSEKELRKTKPFVRITYVVTAYLV